MNDWQAISAIFGGLNVASVYVKGYLAEIKDAAVREKLTEILDSILPLYGQVFSLYESNLTLIKKTNDLEAKLREIEGWDEESKKHETKEIAPSVYVYVKKAGGEDTGSQTHLCTNCFDIHHQKSIIHLKHESYSGKDYLCPNCKNEFHVPSPHKPTSHIVSPGSYF